MNHPITTALLSSSLATALLLLALGCGEDPPQPPTLDAGEEDMGLRDAGGAAEGADIGVDLGPSVDCSGGVRRPAAGEEFERLSEYCLFRGALVEHEPREGVVPYEVNAQLYADGAGKHRFIVLPDGGTIGYRPTGRWEFPVGTILVKSFFFDEGPEGTRRILETRLLTHEADGRWTPQIYLWDEAQRDARRHLIGQKVEVRPSGADAAFTYQVPNKNQCKNCHGQQGLLQPIGPSTRQLNGVSDITGAPEHQLERLTALQMFDQAPAAHDTLQQLVDYADTSEPLHDRALAYLEGNCGHCHNPQGSGGTSGLRLEAHGTSPIDYGVCRRPVAAGGGAGQLTYDIVPGQPEQSILLFRMKSSDPEIKMPELPLRTVDPLGVELIEAWIAAMEGDCETP